MDTKTKKPRLKMYFAPNLMVRIGASGAGDAGFSWQIEYDGAATASGRADNRSLAEEAVEEALRALNMDQESIDRLTGVIHHHGQINLIKGLRQSSTFNVYVREILS